MYSGWRRVCQAREGGEVAEGIEGRGGFLVAILCVEGERERVYACVELVAFVLSGR